MGMGYGMVQENNKLFDENCVGEGNAGGFAGGTFPVDFPCSGVIPFQGSLAGGAPQFLSKRANGGGEASPVFLGFCFSECSCLLKGSLWNERRKERVAAIPRILQNASDHIFVPCGSVLSIGNSLQGSEFCQTI